ncbi:hypothetical protein [Vallitalea guaymasensis]|uniref:hypothetical protein n=1 Tax=Vallitalea guaymasensis TaxID=1185412 RepID=UPI000DE4B833|nr:hypothetical protein [Vallitalea guaymasensis]
MSVIALSSPRKGQGQTTTGINIAAMMSKEYDKDILFVDTNQLCRDVDYYLSDSYFTKGLDDFLNYCDTNKINDDNFMKCMKKTNFGLNLMSSNKCMEIKPNDIDILMYYANEAFPFTFIDVSTPISELIFKHSDRIIVVINQIDITVNMIMGNELYERYKDRIVFVVNRYIRKSEGVKLSYSLKVIRKKLSDIGYKNNMVLPLAYDINLINDCNEQRILNYIETNKKAKYVSDIKQIMTAINK